MRHRRYVWSETGNSGPVAHPQPLTSVTLHHLRSPVVFADDEVARGDVDVAIELRGHVLQCRGGLHEKDQPLSVGETDPLILALQQD